MSKNNPKHNSHPAAPVSQDHALEYRIIRHDLIRVVVLNALYLAIILGLYFSNQKTQYLDHFFANIFHF